MIFIVIFFTIIITLLGFDYYDDEINEETYTKIKSLKKENSNNDSKVNTKLVIKIFYHGNIQNF